MTGKRTAVFAIYPGRVLAEHGVDALIRAGFAACDISMLLADSVGTKDLAYEKHTKAPEGATTGGAAGGAIGGALGFLAGAGAIAIPGVGPLLAAGPLVAALAGLGAGGAIGGLIGALSGLGVPEYEAKRYEGHMVAGGVLLSAHCDSDQAVVTAREVLKRTGGDSIAEAGEEPVDRQDGIRPPGYPVGRT